VKVDIFDLHYQNHLSRPFSLSVSERISLSLNGEKNKLPGEAKTVQTFSPLSVLVDQMNFLCQTTTETELKNEFDGSLRFSSFEKARSLNVDQ
jgi:hypothetical protein